ncbi:MAG: hypothetical protein K6G22_03745 [Lachnospiraceae bacterium]|nr:hypothetical protein [Lachnospiraceae bacterium]
MKIRLTARGKALALKMSAGSMSRKVCKPDIRPFILIRFDSNGKALPTETVMVDINKFFKKTA